MKTSEAINIRKIRGKQKYHATPWGEWKDVMHLGMSGSGDIDEASDNALPCIIGDDGEPFWISETTTGCDFEIDDVSYLLAFHGTSFFSWDEVLWDIDGDRAKTRSCHR